MEENFLLSLYPGRHVILGVTLPLFSFWHLLGLHAIRSPFVIKDGIAELKDLQLAVKICQSRYPDQPDLRTWTSDAWLFFRRRNDIAFVGDQCARFVFYKECHEALPEFWDNENEIVPRSLTAPAILARVASLARRPGFTHSEIWNDIAPGYACWLSSAMAEQEGAELRFQREEDLEEDDLPDLTKLSEEELYQVVLKDLGKEGADTWLANRQAHQNKETV